MLTQDRLVELYRDLRDHKVLSIYVDGEGHDPAERRAWRTRMDQHLSELRRGMNGVEAGEGDAFESAKRHLVRELDRFPAFMPDRGWVGFATSEGMVYADTVPVPMPDLVAWEQGIRAAPYVRALKQARPVVVILADRFKARIFTYRDGVLAETDDLRTDDDMGDLSDANVSKRPTLFSGVGGETATDTAHRLIEVKAEKMVKHAVERVGERAGKEGFVVVGGTSETGSQVLHHLPKGLRDRALELHGLHLQMSDAEVKRKAEEAATELTRRLQVGLVGEVVDQARSGGRSVLGEEGTIQMLLEHRVDTLLLSRSFVQNQPERADHLVGTAFGQGAEVEELSGEGAQRLDVEGDGVAARLRW